LEKKRKRKNSLMRKTDIRLQKLESYSNMYVYIQNKKKLKLSLSKADEFGPKSLYTTNQTNKRKGPKLIYQKSKQLKIHHTVLLSELYLLF
jgi:hypothetical protein